MCTEKGLDQFCFIYFQQFLIIRSLWIVLILRKYMSVMRLQVYPLYTYVYMCVDLALCVLASKPQRISLTNTSKHCKL